MYSADLLTAGFPCQDISLAGKGAGITGSRSGLWGNAIGSVRLVRPKLAVMENVAALLDRGMGTVCGDLAESGYDAEWDCIPATAVGAPHRRDRTWIVANDRSERRERLIPKTIQREQAFSWCKDVRRVEDLPRRSDLYPSLLCGSGDGIPGRVDRLRALGNAIVPQLAEQIFRAIKESEAAEVTA